MDRRKVYSSLGFQDRCEENNFHLQWSHQKLNITCTLEYVCWLEDSELRVPSSEELLTLDSEFRRSEFWKLDWILESGSGTGALSSTCKGTCRENLLMCFRFVAIYIVYGIFVAQFSSQKQIKDKQVKDLVDLLLGWTCLSTCLGTKKWVDVAVIRFLKRRNLTNSSWS